MGKWKVINGKNRNNKMNKQERSEYFENLIQKLGITKEKRKPYIEFLINQKRSDKWLNQKLDIEVLEEMKKEIGKGEV